MEVGVGSHCPLAVKVEPDGHAGVLDTHLLPLKQVPDGHADCSHCPKAVLKSKPSGQRLVPGGAGGLAALVCGGY